MKRSLALILTLAIFILTAAGGAALMFLTPQGPLNPDSPEKAMQACMDSMTTEDWKSEFLRLYTAETTEFEDSAAVTEHIWEELAGDGPFSFREYKGVSTGKTPVYIVSGAGDLMTVSLSYRDRSWQTEEFSVPEELFQPGTRTLTVLVPSDSRVTLNGLPLGEEYILQEDVPYEDLTELELEFDSVPHRTLYSVPGIYENAEIDAEREGGCVPVSSDGTEWVWTVPDAGAYSFSVSAPAGTVITVNGAELTEREHRGEQVLEPLTDVPEELRAYLPEFTHYEASGLYTVPEISAADSEGNPLTPLESKDGTLQFMPAGSEALREEHGALAEKFIENLCEYGAGHTGRAFPADYTVPDTDINRYFRDASGSLIWVQGMNVDYGSIESYDYIPLGEEAFLCKARLVCTTRTYYQTVDLDLEYELLFQKQGERWLVADLAFTDHFDRTRQ